MAKVKPRCCRTEADPERSRTKVELEGRRNSMEPGDKLQMKAQNPMVKAKRRLTKAKLEAQGSPEG